MTKVEPIRFQVHSVLVEGTDDCRYGHYEFINVECYRQPLTCNGQKVYDKDGFLILDLPDGLTIRSVLADDTVAPKG